MQVDFLEMGYSLRRSENSFFTNASGVTYDFYLIFTSAKDSVLVEPRWAITVDAIVNLYNKASTKEPKYHKYSVVLENSLGELINFVDHKIEPGTSTRFEYQIENEDDIEILTRVIPKRFREYVLPYFNENGTVSRVDELLNRNPRELTIHNWLSPLRAIMGIIAAKLNHNPEFNHLVRLYRSELKEAEESYVKEFESTVNLLNTLE